MDPVAAADYHDIVQVSDPQVAPNGETVAFVRKVPEDDEAYEATVYTVPVDGGKPSQFTVAEGVDSSPRYSPSGDRLAFVSTRGADDDRPQLWVLPTGGGEARQVTNVAGGVESIAWSPDGSRIAFTQRSTPDEREAGLDLDLADAGEEDADAEYEREPPDPRVIDRLVFRTGTNYLDGSNAHLYLVDLEDDSVERLSGGGPDDDAPIETDGKRDITAAEWGGEDELYYAVCREADPDDTSRYDVEVIDLEADDVDTVVETSGWGATLAATADGRVAFPHTPEERTSLRQTELRVHDRSSGDTHEPTAGLDRTLAFDAGVEWGPDEDRLYFATPDQGAVALRRWDGTDVETLVHEGGLTGFSVGEDDVAFVQSQWDHRGDVFVVAEDGSTRLTNVNADYLERHAVQEPEELWFEGGGGDEVQGWVLTPPDFDPEGRYPLAVEVHGGPHAMWTTSGTMWHEFQTLAARGYVVFWSNPRGSTGYGETFMSAIERDWGRVTMADVLAGVELVCERDYVDADDLHLTGGSFGGYMTGWMVGHTDRFASAVAQRGVFDQLGFYGSTDWAFKLVEGDYDTTPNEEPMFLWEQSPAAHADAVDTPTLVVHADRDFRVPVNNAELFHRLLHKHGVDTRLVRYPRDGHELSRSGEPGHVVDRLERIVRWFDGYSSHHDADRALDRGDDGLTAGEE